MKHPKIFTVKICRGKEVMGKILPMIDREIAPIAPPNPIKKKFNGHPSIHTVSRMINYLLLGLQVSIL